MPRVAVTGFVGPSHTLQSRTLDDERTVNLIMQPTGPGTGRASGGLINRPGLVPWATYPGASSIRGLFHLNNRLYMVASSTFAEVFSDGTFGTGHTLQNDGLPVTMCSSGTASDQIFITSGGLGYVYDTALDTLTQIADANFLVPTTCGEFMDGYFLNVLIATRQFQWSALEDALSWSGVDIAERSIAADSIMVIIRNHRELWILGQQTSEVWYDSGDASTPFQPIQGVLIEHGCEAAMSARRVDNSIMWLGRDADGKNVVWRADGYTPKRVSTTAMERVVQAAAHTDHAVAWTCQMEGHAYYVLIVPSLDTSWVYDVSLDRWYEWAHWDPITCAWVPFRPWNHVFAFEQHHLVGDRLSGTIYRLTPDVFTDRLVAV